MTWWTIILSYQQSHSKNTWVLCNSKRIPLFIVNKNNFFEQKRLSLYNRFCWGEKNQRKLCLSSVHLFYFNSNTNNSQVKIVWAWHWVERKILQVWPKSYKYFHFTKLIWNFLSLATSLFYHSSLVKNYIWSGNFTFYSVTLKNKQFDIYGFKIVEILG